MSITYVETKKIKHPELLVDTIYNNFRYLETFPEQLHTKKDISKSLMTQDNLIYLAYHDKKLVGYLVGDFRTLTDNRYVYYISYFYVITPFRNKKVGTKMMDMCLTKCRDQGIKFIVLTCDSQDDKIMKFYKRYGFVADPILKSANKNCVFCLYL